MHFYVMMANVPEFGMYGKLYPISNNVYEFISLIPIRVHCYCGIDDVKEIEL